MDICGKSAVVNGEAQFGGKNATEGPHVLVVPDGGVEVKVSERTGNKYIEVQLQVFDGPEKGAFVKRETFVYTGGNHDYAETRIATLLDVTGLIDEFNAKVNQEFSGYDSLFQDEAISEWLANGLKIRLPGKPFGAMVYNKKETYVKDGATQESISANLGDMLAIPKFAEKYPQADGGIAVRLNGGATVQSAPAQATQAPPAGQAQAPARSGQVAW